MAFRVLGRFISHLLVVVVLASMVTTADCGEVTEWTDSTGQHKVSAEFLGIVDGKVELQRKSDGKKLTIELEMLSEADQARAKKLAAGKSGDNPFMEAAENAAAGKGQPEDVFKPGDEVLAKRFTKWVPARVIKEARGRYYVRFDGRGSVSDQWVPRDRVRSRTAGAGGMGADDAENPVVLEPTYADADYNGRTLLFTTFKSDWNVEPCKDTEATIKEQGALALPASSEFFEAADERVVIDHSTGIGVVTYVNRRPGQPTRCRTLWCNLTDRSPIGSMILPYAGVVEDVAPGGKVVAALGKSNPHQQAPPRIDVYRRTESGPLEHVVSWAPMQEGVGIFQEIKWVRFIDEQHVMVFDANGRLQAWQLVGPKLLYQYETNHFALPAITNDRRYFAVPFDQGVAVCETLTGDQIGAIVNDRLAHGWLRMAFKSDNSTLAVFASGRSASYDMKTGEKLKELTVGVVAFNSVHWLSDRYLLVDGSKVVDMDQDMILWEYWAPFGELADVYGGMAWFVFPNHPNEAGAVVNAVLPHQEAVFYAERMDSPQLQLLKPGDGLRLNVQTQNADEVRKQLEKAIVEAGFRVDPNAANELVASIKAEPRKEVTYRSFHGGEKSTQSYTPHTSSVQICTDKGKVAWSTATTTGPEYFVNMKEIDKAIAKSNQPNYKFFERVELPRTILKPEYQRGLGHSTVSRTGLKTDISPTTSTTTPQ